MAGALRMEAPDALFWSVYYPTNFGDWIGPYLYQAMVGHGAIFRVPDSQSRRSVYMTAGSIMELVAKNSIVWGSGILRRGARFPRPWRTVAVRGPHTQRRFDELGYEYPAVVGDPGLLMPLVYPAQPARSAVLGIIPHYVDYARVRSMFDGVPGVHVIDVTYPVERVVDEIVSCEMTVSSSLHGLIISHAYGIPSAWVEFSNELTGDGVKFLDYYASAGVDNVKTRQIPGRVSLHELSGLVADAPRANLLPLRRPLLQACPFPIPAATREELFRRIDVAPSR